MPTLSGLMVLAGILAAVPPLVPERRVPTGEWGGAHARLDVQASSARVELDCAHGTIEGALRLGKGGRFRANGTYQSERGPSVSEGDAGGRPARYSGMLKGSVLTLRILTEDGQHLGPFQLERGARAELVKCQ